MIEYQYRNADPTYANAYIWPVLRNVVEAHDWRQRRAFDLGCGNGATCNMLSTLDFDVTGVDTSESGIANAQKAYPHVKTQVRSAYDDLASEFGTFPLVVSLEVIEHCIDPQAFARAFLGLIAPGGIGLLSTPYHGYLKNLTLAVTGQMDRHIVRRVSKRATEVSGLRVIAQQRQGHAGHEPDVLQTFAVVGHGQGFNGG